MIGKWVFSRNFCKTSQNRHPDLRPRIYPQIAPISLLLNDLHNPTIQRQKQSQRHFQPPEKKAFSRQKKMQGLKFSLRTPCLARATGSMMLTSLTPKAAEACSRKHSLRSCNRSAPWPAEPSQNLRTALDRCRVRSYICSVHRDFGQSGLRA